MFSCLNCGDDAQWFLKSLSILRRIHLTVIVFDVIGSNAQPEFSWKPTNVNKITKLVGRSRRRTIEHLCHDVFNIKRPWSLFHLCRWGWLFPFNVDWSYRQQSIENMHMKVLVLDEHPSKRQSTHRTVVCYVSQPVTSCLADQKSERSFCQTPHPT